MVNDERTVQDFMPDSEPPSEFVVTGCLLYTSDAADE